MPDQDIPEDDCLAFTFDLPFLADHPHRTEIQDRLAGAAEDLVDLMDDDVTLLAHVLAAAGLCLWQADAATKDGEAPLELAFAESIEALHRFSDDAAWDIPPAPRRTAWDIANTFQRTGAGQRLHLLQCGADVEGSHVTCETITATLEAEADFFARAEAEFRDAARAEEMTLVASQDAWFAEATPEAFATEEKYVLFADRHLYAGYFWRANIRGRLKHCVSGFDHAALVALLAAAEKQPPLFRAVFPDDIEALPGKLREIERDLVSALSEGLDIPAARALGDRHNLARFDISVKPWLDRLVVEGRARKDKKDGKVAYWSPS